MHRRWYSRHAFAIYVCQSLVNLCDVPWGFSLIFFAFSRVSPKVRRSGPDFSPEFYFLKKSHSICPLHRILTCWRFILSRNLFIQNAPEDPRDLFVRPEVRAMSKGPMEMKLRCLETYAPGDALMERTNCMWIIRLAAETWQR